MAESDKNQLKPVIWTDYLEYKLSIRGFEKKIVEQILRQTHERYKDQETGRLIAIGSHGADLVMIPYEINSDAYTPITIHVTSRQQVNIRIKSGRLISNE